MRTAVSLRVHQQANADQIEEVFVTDNYTVIKLLDGTRLELSAELVEQIVTAYALWGKGK